MHPSNGFISPRVSAVLLLEGVKPEETIERQLR